MDTTQQPAPTPPELQPQPGPGEVPSLPKQDTHGPIIVVLIIAIVVLAVAILGLLLTRQALRGGGASTQPTPTVSNAPTGQAQRELSPIATESGFLALDESVRLLAASISGSKVVDQQIIGWPVLDLPLGFSK